MQKSKKYSHIIWDWNGTLFDDVEWCIDTMNRMLIKRNIKAISGILEYHRLFRFPVIEYYEKVGFDFEKEPFEELAVEFINEYHSREYGKCRLNKNAKTVLKAVYEMDLPQIVLSASEINDLSSQIDELGVRCYFDEILGLSNIYAKSKVELGLDFIKRNNVRRALLIGDTVHDFETALAIGADCVLIAGGHQSKEQLVGCGVCVFDDISEVVEYIS